MLEKTEKIRDSLKRFLWFNSEKSSGPPVSPSPAPPAQTSGPRDGQDDFARQLGPILARRDVVAAGRLQLINLARISDRIGGRWTDVADKVHIVVERILQRRLANTDLYRRYGEHTYILVFGELAKEEAEIKSALIAKEISEKLLGANAESGEDGVLVQTVVADVNGKLAVEEVDALNIIARLLEQAAQAGAAGRPAETGPQASGARSETDNPGPMATGVAWRSSPGKGSKGGVFEAAARRQDPAWQAPAPYRSRPRSLRDEVDFVYRPIWDVRRSALLSFLVIPVPKDAMPEPLTGGEIFWPNPEPWLVSELDVLTLECARRTIDALFRKGRRLVLSCGIHFETLISPASRKTYLGICASLAEAWRPYIQFEIKGVGQDTPNSALADAVSRIRPFGRSVFLHLPFDCGSLAFVEDCGVQAVGIDNGNSSIGEAEKMAQHTFLAVLAKAKRFKSFAYGIDSLSMATSAVCAGFDFVSGQAICSVERTVMNAYRFNPSDLFMKVARTP